MDTPTAYFHWGFILISMPSLLVIAGMIVILGIALVATFPRSAKGDDDRCVVYKNSWSAN